MYTSHQKECIPITVLSVLGATSNFFAERSISISLSIPHCGSRVELLFVLFFQANAPFFSFFYYIKLPFLLVSQARKFILSRTLCFSHRWTYTPVSALHARPHLESDRLEVILRFAMSEPVQRGLLNRSRMLHGPTHNSYAGPWALWSNLSRRPTGGRLQEECQVASRTANQLRSAPRLRKEF
jgi:hypothetical protein